MGEEEASPLVSNLGILDRLSGQSINEILEGYTGYCVPMEALLSGSGDLSVPPQFVSHVHSLCRHGLETFVCNHFLKSLEETFDRNGAAKFWQHFDNYTNVASQEKNLTPGFDNELHQFFCRALQEISLEKEYQEKCLLMLAHALQSYKESLPKGKHESDAERSYLFSRYQLMVSSVLMASLPHCFPEILHQHFKGKLKELSTIIDGGINDDDDDPQDTDDMDLDKKKTNCLLKVVKWILMNVISTVN